MMTEPPGKVDLKTQFVEPLSGYLDSILLPLFDRGDVASSVAWSTPYQVTWEVMVPERSMRFALGKQGATVNAIRTLMRARAGGLRRALGLQHNVLVDVHIGARVETREASPV